MSRWLLVLGLLGCGRIGFDEDLAPARSVLRLDRVAPTETLVSFPLPVTLDAGRADLARLDPSTLRFRTADGTELPHELETIGPPLVAWVLVPAISGTTTELVVEYGGEPAPASPPVFGSEYAGVWHMTGEGPVLDSSPFARDGEVTGTTRATGLIGEARDYVLGDCAIVRAFSALQLPASVTLSAWIWLRSATIDYVAALTRQKEDMVVDDLYLGTQNMIVFGAVATNPTGTPTLIDTTMTTVTAWHRLAYVFDGTMARLYVDAKEVAAGAGGGIPLASANPLFLGCGRSLTSAANDVPDGDFLDGLLDEVRVEPARSPAWLAFEQAAHRDAVISYGPVE